MTTRLTVASTVLLLCVASAVWAQATFSDVPDDHPQADDIAYAVSQGWFAGYEDGTFRPDATLIDRHVVTVFRRAFPDGVSRADLATVLRAGQTALNTTTPTTTPATTPTTTPTVGTGSWEYFDGTGLHGDYEGYRVTSTSSSAPDWEDRDPVLFVRCGVGNDEWDSVFIATPFLLFNDNTTDTMTVAYRFDDQTQVTTDNGWWSSEDSTSALFASSASSGFARALQNTDGDYLYTSLRGRNDTESAEFDITGLDAVLEALDCI